MTLAEKSEFAHQIFMLLLVLCKDKIDGGYKESALMTVNDAAPDRAGMKSRLAQWSVNLVDFIDADATMTPMIFSLDPFTTNYMQNGYKNVFNQFLTGTSISGLVNNCGIVFGKEDNDLFITKTFATHNRNTADSRKDNDVDCSSNNNKRKKGYVHTSCDKASEHDNDFDQIFKPEGSFFVELYRAGDPTRWQTPSGVYGVNNELDLARRNPDSEPVWRIAISQPAKNKPGDTLDGNTSEITEKRRNSVVKELEDTAKRRSYTFQSHQWYQSLPQPAFGEEMKFSGGNVAKPERFIFFVNESPTYMNPTLTDNDLSKRSFVNFGGVNTNGTRNTPDVTLKPNDFLVIAPRVFTSFSSKEVDESAVGTSNSFGIPDLTEGTYIDLKLLAANTHVKTMVAAMKASELNTSDNSWDVSAENILTLGFRRAAEVKEIDTNYRGIGANISEPIPTTDITDNMTSKYYSKPAADVSVVDSNNNQYYKDSYYKLPTTPDSAFDTPKYSADNDFVKGFGTITGFRSVFLQRLADPNRKYHPVNNPYITVDWSMVDLHVFTSEQVKVGENNAVHDGGEFKAPGGKDNLKFSANADDGLYFNIREWGTTATIRATDDFTNNNNSHKQPNIRDRAFATESYKEKIENNPSLLGDKMDQNYKPPKLPASSNANYHTWGALSSKYGEKHGSIIPLGNRHPNINFAGIPKRGFLHFPWNDSPLANTFEIMLVPATSASRFGYDCYDTLGNGGLPAQGAKSLGMDGSARFMNPDAHTSPYLNFFSKNSTPTVSGNPANDNSLDLVRLFEYVHVPSRFINTTQPLSAMREPGKINLNTMTEKSWIALGGTSTSYNNIKIQRNPSDNIEFSKPFRSPHAINMVPNDTMLRTPVDATLLGMGMQKGENLYTNLHHLLRLSEMTTTRSNVFAIWITTGYFRVDDDGKLCEEIGADDGTIERHRDFYIIDRSIPVGFRRGEKLNTDNIILLKKSLE
jgi:hypothetical protein